MAVKSKKLIIVESPTKAETIKNFLPKSEYDVIASKGHIRTVPEDGMNIDFATYKPKYEIIPGKEKIIAEIKSKVANASEVLLATDEDREGESISWHLLQVCDINVPYKRMVFHEITKSAIEKAASEGRALNQNLVDAQEARRVLDRLVGYSASPVLWKKLSNKKLSAGRVQSPGLRLVVDREMARLNFLSAKYWDLKAVAGNLSAVLKEVNGKKLVDSKSFDPITGVIIKAENKILLNEEAVDDLRMDLLHADFCVSSISSKDSERAPFAPFTTSTLQQDASRKLHVGVKTIMSIAQSLFEKGFITYLRTDNISLSEEATKVARKIAKDKYSENSIPEKPRVYVSKSQLAQEAHEAIRPAIMDSTKSFLDPEKSGLTGNELRLYTLIYQRTIASQMKNAKLSTTTIVLNAKTQKNDANFVATGTSVLYSGFMSVYQEHKDENEEEETESFIPMLQVGQVLTMEDIQKVFHETKPASRFTEALLIKELEKLGIGRPSTYAQIIDTLVGKNYVVIESGALVPTFSGLAVMQVIKQGFENLVDYNFTTKMEEDLDKIANGQEKEFEYLKNFYEGENGFSLICDEANASLDAKQMKCISLPQIKRYSIFQGPYGPYVVANNDAKVSLPTQWLPYLTTDEKIDEILSYPKQIGFTADKQVVNICKGRYGFYLQVGEDLNVSIPSSYNKPVSQMTIEEALELINNKLEGKEEALVVGTDVQTNLPIMQYLGKFGPYWQIGKNDDVKKGEKPKRFSIPKECVGAEVSEDFIQKCFALPTVLGKNENGVEIKIGTGRFGPYVQCGSDFRSIKTYKELFDLNLETALEICNTPKASKKETASVEPIVDFGEVDGSKLVIISGPYGLYIKHGKDNYPLPTEYKKDEAKCKELSLEQVKTYLVKSDKPKKVVRKKKTK